MGHMNKIIVSLPKPRNPLVALTRCRKAGAHRQNKRMGRRDLQKLAD